MSNCPDCGEWTTPHVTVDAVVVNQGRVLLIERGREPFKGRKAWPGGFMDVGESPEDACLRELAEETALNGEITGLLCVRGEPQRDPRKHIVSIFYLVKAEGDPQAGDDASSAKWYPISEVKNWPLENWAFDHREVFEKLLSNL